MINVDVSVKTKKNNIWNHPVICNCDVVIIQQVLLKIQ